MEVLKRIELDFARNVTDVTVYAKQYDANSRVIEIVPLNMGKRWSLESGTTARLHLTKANGHTVIVDAEIANEGNILIRLTEQSLNVSGKALAEIVLYSGDAVISSQKFFINVEKAAYDEQAPKSSVEYNSLVSLLAKTENATNKAQNVTEQLQLAAKEVEDALKNLDYAGSLVSPTIDVIAQDNGHKVIITDKNGSKEFLVLNGADGSSGAAHTHENATESKSGFLSAEDKAKLNGIESGAQVNTVTGVKGEVQTGYMTGNISISSADIGAAPVSHEHSAANITSGTLNSNRLPTIPISKGGTGAANSNSALESLGLRKLITLAAKAKMRITFASNSGGLICVTGTSSADVGGLWYFSSSPNGIQLTALNTSTKINSKVYSANLALEFENTNTGTHFLSVMLFYGSITEVKAV